MELEREIMNKRWLAPASLMLIACGSSAFGGCIGGAYPVLVAAQDESNPKDTPIRQSLRQDPLYSSAAATSRGLFDGTADVRPQPTFIMTEAQTKAVRLIASETLNPDTALQISEAAEPSIPPTVDSTADPAYDLSRFGSASLEDTSTAFASDEGGTRNSISANSSDLSDAGGILSLYHEGLSVADIIQYEMTKPWLFVGLLLSTATIALVVTLYRRAMAVAEPPPM
jgi:hypothetical protein